MNSEILPKPLKASEGWSAFPSIDIFAASRTLNEISLDVPTVSLLMCPAWLMLFFFFPNTAILPVFQLVDDLVARQNPNVAARKGLEEGLSVMAGDQTVVT